ncbi:MAG: hypothetical protein JEZ11_11865 [Desulfobacterales bacterium]|nr:hypothetical protein [Desulfobacterales bacterium]
MTGFGVLIWIATAVFAAVPATAGQAQPGVDAVAPAAAMTDILDIKPPEVFGLDPILVRYGLYAAGVAALLAGAALAWWLWRRRRARQVETVEAELAPEDLALSRIDALAREELGDKHFYFRLSAILRAYLLGQFGLGAPEMTTEELLPRITRLNLATELGQGLRRFLIYGDGIKFAGQSAEPQQQTADLDFARWFVRQTTPVTEIPTPNILPAKSFTGQG